MSQFAQLEQLCRTIEQRKTSDPKDSYVAKMLLKGPLKIAKKVGEEGVEVAIAAAASDRGQVVLESSDLLFHLLLLWQAMGIVPSEVMEELVRREARSGLEEKASRSEE
jgi:phosphoribosyl-ATP pyrophosphohydrolase